MIQVDLPREDSLLVICPQCFDIWARLSGRDTTFWWHRYVPCEVHPQSCFPYGCQVAGSLLDAELDLISVLPPELLEREFLLTIQAKEVS
jgi:hypothetical protein